MDLRAYYQKIRKLEAEMESCVVVVSRETSDGGKPGIMTDVPRGIAAKLIVEEQATLASPEQASQFRAETKEQRQAADELETPAEAVAKPIRSAKRDLRRP